MLDSETVARGVADDLVIYVGDVHDVVQGVTALAQKTAQHVYRNKRAEISDMAVVINGWSAGIHANLVVLERTELLDLAGKRVVEAQRHQE